MYSCNDLAVAAWFELNGSPCQRIEPDPANPKRALFFFIDDGTLDDLLTAFRSGQALVDPQKYKAIESYLRDRMFAALKREGGRR
jgi:hypothetical protein